MTSENTPHFKTCARLLCQLGEQLIKNESIALLELVKNAYDADASYCRVQIEHVEDPEQSVITIDDDGVGMDYDTLANVWLEVGTDNKASVKKKRHYSEKFHRLPLGEKGIGRFGVHRLGKEIELITRSVDQSECVLKIDWNEIQSVRYMEEFPIYLENRAPTLFKNTTGTRIVRRI